MQGIPGGLVTGLLSRIMLDFTTGKQLLTERAIRNFLNDADNSLCNVVVKSTKLAEHSTKHF